MRITDRMIQMNTMSGLRANVARLNDAQRRATSGKRIETISDDPVDATQAMRMQAQIGNIDQYKRNATSATTRLATEQTVLQASRDLLSRARALAISVNATDPADPSRASALEQLKVLQEQLVSLANTRVGDERLFGGGETNPPFQADGSYVGGTSTHDVRIDDGVTLTTSHTGAIFAATFQAMDQLKTALTSGTPADIAATVTPLANAEEGLLAVEAQNGGRQQQVDLSVKQLGSRQAMLLDRMQVLTDVDPTEAMLKVTASTQALERAYAVAQRTLSVNIMDYMK
jgi:flagellar hook-associated protein 3 FlgL